jgi:hypothetical protein
VGINCVALDRVPELLDRDVVAPTALSVHADLDLETAQDVPAGGAVVRVKSLGAAEAIERLLCIALWISTLA